MLSCNPREKHQDHNNQLFMITEQEVKEKTLERFWNKIKFGELNECWEWQATRFPNGYGCFKIRENNIGHSVGAHRVIYEAMFTDFDKTLQVLHSCDNKRCVNPNHLSMGTLQDNMADKNSKGRQAFGGRHGRSKITDEQARIIKTRLSHGFRNMDICREFNISQHIVSGIRRGIKWKHIYV